MTFQDLLGAIDFERVLKICVVHDLGEAIRGDISATVQMTAAKKSQIERGDLIELCRSLPAHVQEDFLALWEEYEAESTFEAKIVKALDKMETIIQHNQGNNPPDFDYEFNLKFRRHQPEFPCSINHLRWILGLGF